MFKYLKTNAEKGVSVVEILVVIFILSVAFVSILGLLSFSLQVSSLTKAKIQAVNLAQDTVEAVRNFRDGTDWEIDGLGFLNIDTIYHPEKTLDIPPKWTMVLGAETINGFSRYVIFENVNRDANDDIVEGSGTLDPKTRKATITVSWEDESLEIVTYFTDWQ